MWPRLKLALVLLLSSGCLQDGCYADADTGYIPGVSNVTDKPCDSTKRPLSWSVPTELGYTANELRPLIDGLKMQTLQWTRGKRSVIELSFADPVPSFIDQRTSEGFAAPSYATTCSDYIRIDAVLLVGTGDGELANVERKISLRAYSSEELFGEVLLEPDSFEGTFVPTAMNNHCYRGLQIKVLLSEGNFSGSLNQQYSRGSCEEGDTKTSAELVAAHWGVRWQSY